MAGDDASDDLNDDNIEDAADESKGVRSDAGGSPVLVLASRLQTGQNVLQEVSQASTQVAWNSFKFKKEQVSEAIEKYDHQTQSKYNITDAIINTYYAGMVKL